MAATGTIAFSPATPARNLESLWSGGRPIYRQTSAGQRPASGPAAAPAHRGRTRGAHTAAASPDLKWTTGGKTSEDTIDGARERSQDARWSSLRRFVTATGWRPMALQRLRSTSADGRQRPGPHRSTPGHRLDQTRARRTPGARRSLAQRKLAWVRAEVLAVADGIVISTKDGIPDNMPLTEKRAVPITLETSPAITSYSTSATDATRRLGTSFQSHFGCQSERRSAAGRYWVCWETRATRTLRTCTSTSPTAPRHSDRRACLTCSNRCCSAARPRPSTSSSRTMPGFRRRER